MTMNCKEKISALFSHIEGFRAEKMTAGSKFRLAAIVADVTELSEQLNEALQRLRQEVVLDADEDVDYADLSEQVLTMELEERTDCGEEIHEQTRLVNEGLGMLSSVLSEIDEQLSRHHKEEEYARLYETEKRRYMNSGTSKRTKRDFDEWKENMNCGNPSLEDMEDYRLEKLIHMFEKGVFDDRVKHMQRARRFPDELDFDQVDENHKITKTPYHHYAALRRLVVFKDGMLVVDPVHVGQHFFASRKEANAKAHRTNFLKYMHKISMAQELYEGLKMENGRLNVLRTAEGAEKAEGLNMFAPAKQLKVMLGEEWFGIHSTDKRFDKAWTEQFIDRLMASPHGREIAIEWSNKKKRDFLRGCIVGLLKEGGVLKGSMDSIARSTGVCENYRTFSKYMGQSVQEPYAEWVLNYIKE